MIIGLENLPELRKGNNDKVIVLTGGVFDLIHRGHIDYLREVKNLGDILVVAITNDKRVRERKGESRPIQTELDRAYIIDELKPVSYTIILPERNDENHIPTKDVIYALKPDKFVSIDEEWLDHKDEFDNKNIELVILPITKVNSTSELIKKAKIS